MDYKLRKDACEPEDDRFEAMTEKCWYTCTDGECTEPAGNDQVFYQEEVLSKKEKDSSQHFFFLKKNSVLTRA